MKTSNSVGNGAESSKTIGSGGQPTDEIISAFEKDNEERYVQK